MKTKENDPQLLTPFDLRKLAEEKLKALKANAAKYPDHHQSHFGLLIFQLDQLQKENFKLDDQFPEHPPLVGDKSPQWKEQCQIADDAFLKRKLASWQMLILCIDQTESLLQEKKPESDSVKNEITLLRECVDSTKRIIQDPKKQDNINYVQEMQSKLSEHLEKSDTRLKRKELKKAILQAMGIVMLLTGVCMLLVSPASFGGSFVPGLALIVGGATLLGAGAGIAYFAKFGINIQPSKTKIRHETHQKISTSMHTLHKKSSIVSPDSMRESDLPRPKK